MIDKLRQQVSSSRATLAALAFALLATFTAAAQTDITTTMTPEQAAAQVIRVAVPFPELRPVEGTSPSPVSSEVVRHSFFAPLTRDIAYSDVFAIAPLPPGVPVTPDLLRRIQAQMHLQLNVWREGEEYVVEARVFDASGAAQLRKRYRAPEAALSRTAHTVANELLRLVNGRPGVFMSQIAFASKRTGRWEIWLMDWDGQNQRQISRHSALSILPSWAPDNERMVYTSFDRGTSDMYIINRRGGGRMRINSGLSLNTSATFSPVSNDIAFVGSQRGNPDIYVIKDDGTNLRRLTTENSIESTPEWSPNGRQIAFTSGRSGTPQIYIMDAEGTNVRRVSQDGNWNDDANFSPNGEELAYTSRVNGRFQIRIANLVTGASRIVAGEGSNEQPTWSPDGQWLAFQSNRSGTWQIYRMRVDGRDLLQLTFDGENKTADWSKKPE